VTDTFLPPAADATEPEFPAAPVVPVDFSGAVVVKPATPARTSTPNRRPRRDDSSSRRRPVREELYVRVPGEDAAMAQFFRITEHVGQKMPFEHPLFTCALQVHPDAVFFSLLQVTAKNRPDLVAAPVVLPRGPMGQTRTRLDAFATAGIELIPGEIHVLLHEKDADDVHTVMTVTKDAHGIATLELADPEDVDAFDLPRGAVRVSLFTRSAKTGRVVAAFAIIYPGKGGTPTSMRRVAASALNSLCGLAEFRMLVDIETVNVPAAATERARTAVTTKVKFDVPVRMFAPDEAPLPVGNGIVKVEVDLDNPPVNGRLRYTITPAKELRGEFETFRLAFEEGLAFQLRSQMDAAEVEGIAYEIILGEVGTGTIERLSEAFTGLTGLDLTPRRSQPFAA
jgi:hypothetical protein